MHISYKTYVIVESNENGGGDERERETNQRKTNKWKKEKNRKILENKRRKSEMYQQKLKKFDVEK